MSFEIPHGMDARINPWVQDYAKAIGVSREERDEGARGMFHPKESRMRQHDSE